MNMKKTFSYLLTLATLSLSLSPSLSPTLEAWWDMGHLISAQIAYGDLHPEVREKVDHYLATVSDPFPNHADFVSSSLWADDIVNEGLRALSPWHKSPRPYDSENILSQEKIDLLIAQMEMRDIVWAIGECIKTLQHPKASDWTKGFTLRMLIHLVGDIHQPLHCITLYNADFPEGDYIGTKFAIKHEKYTNLHNIWDAAFGLGDRLPERPLSAEDRRITRELAHDFITKYSRETLQNNLQEKDPYTWLQEGYHISATFAYPGIAAPGSEPTSDYLRVGQNVSSEQLALAGYRLADLLNEILAE